MIQVDSHIIYFIYNITPQQKISRLCKVEKPLSRKGATKLYNVYQPFEAVKNPQITKLQSTN